MSKTLSARTKKRKKISISSKERGISLYLTVFVMIVLLGIALGLSSIFFTQLELLRGIDDSILAFYAAEAGMERQLYEGTLPPPPVSYSGTLDNGATYNVRVILATATECNGTEFCIESIGSYEQAQRAIWVER